MTDKDGNNALLWSCMVGEMKVFEYLVKECQIDKDYIINLKNNEDETCIDWIAQNRDVCGDGVILLESMGINVPPPEQYDNDDEDEDSNDDDDEDSNDDDYDDGSDDDDNGSRQSNNRANG